MSSDEPMTHQAEQHHPTNPWLIGVNTTPSVRQDARWSDEPALELTLHMPSHLRTCALIGSPDHEPSCRQSYPSTSTSSSFLSTDSVHELVLPAAVQSASAQSTTPILSGRDPPLGRHPAGVQPSAASALSSRVAHSQQAPYSSRRSARPRSEGWIGPLGELMVDLAGHSLLALGRRRRRPERAWPSRRTVGAAVQAEEGRLAGSA